MWKSPHDFVKQTHTHLVIFLFEEPVGSFLVFWSGKECPAYILVKSILERWVENFQNSKILAFQLHYLEHVHSETVSLTVWWYVNKMFKNLYIWFFTVFTDTESLLVYTAIQCSPPLQNSYSLTYSQLWTCIRVHSSHV